MNTVHRFGINSYRMANGLTFDFEIANAQLDQIFIPTARGSCYLVVGGWVLVQSTRENETVYIGYVLQKTANPRNQQPMISSPE